MIFLLWSCLGLNQGPPDYESGATNQLSYRTATLSLGAKMIFNHFAGAKVLLFFETTKKNKEKREKNCFWLQMCKKNVIFARYFKNRIKFK